MAFSFDGTYRATARGPEALANNTTATTASLTAGLPALLTTLAGDITGWAGNPTTAQVALAVSDAQALATCLERLHTAVHTARKGT